MMIYAITYSDENYIRSAKLNVLTAKRIGGADKVKIYSPDDLSENFKSENKEMLSNKRGAGYWIWKPYIMLDMLSKMRGGYLIYLDAGAFYVRKISALIANMQKLDTDVFLSSIMLPNKDWCKRDAFITADCDVDECIYAHQIEASYVVVKKSDRAEKFLRRWLEYVCDPRINSDQENVLGKDNYTGYRENRHDQTALSLAAFKEGYIGHRGFSDSSEYRIFKKRKEDFGCWGYSDEEIIKMAYDEYTSKGFQESDYKRIVINCRARNQSLYPFAKAVFRSIRSAIYIDMHRQKDVDAILKISKGRNDNEDKAGDQDA